MLTSKRFCTTYNLKYLIGNSSLSCFIILKCQIADHTCGIVSCLMHCRHSVHHVQQQTNQELLYKTEFLVILESVP